MSTAAKRELDSPSQESASKRRRQNNVHDDDNHHDEHNVEIGTVRTYNPKNLLKSDSSFLSPASLADDAAVEGSAYQRKRITLNLLIPPSDLDDPLSGVERQLDDVLLTYLRECRGILMGWRDIQFLRPSGRVLEESPFSPALLSIDALLWRPRRGEKVLGAIKFMGPSHIGLLILDTFNASIPLPNIPSDWHYQSSSSLLDDDDDGSWVDGNGNKLLVNQTLHFLTVNVKKGANILSVEGSLLNQVSLPKNDDSGRDSSPQLVQAPVVGVKQEKQSNQDEQAVMEESPSKAQRKADKERRKSEKKANKEKRKSKS